MGWITKKLGEVCTFQGGSQPPKSTFIYEPKDGYIRLIQIRDYKSDKHIVYIPEKLAKRHCIKNDVMIGRYGPPIFQILRGIEGAYNVALMKAIPDETVIDNDFLFLFLKSPAIQKYVIESSSRAAGQSGLNKATLEPYPISFPSSLEEQKRIVAILDEAFAGIDKAIENTEKNLANVKELFESTLNNIFTQKGDGWVEKKLPDISINLDKQRVPITKSHREAGDIPYYGASGVVDYVKDFIFNGDYLLVSEDGANLLMRTYPIAFPITGKSWVNNHAHILKFHDLTSQKFIEYYLNSISLGPYVSGMAQPKLNQKMLNSIPVPFPDIIEQKSTVDLLDQLSTDLKKIETVYQQKLTALKELKQSLLQKAFAGELTSDLRDVA